MRRRRLVLMVAAITVSASTVAPVADAMPETMVLRGPSGAAGTRATDINNSFTVIGTYNWATPVRWDSIGRITTLPVPPEPSVAFDMREITDSGFIIGNTYRDDGAGGNLYSALLWDPRGNLVDLRHLPGMPQTRATDVNESGTVVGIATAADGRQHAVRWNAQGQATELPMLRGGDSSYAAAINDQGLVAGHSDVVIASTHVTHAVTWDAADRRLDLGGPVSAVESRATAVNDAGTTVGVRGTDAARWDRLGRAWVLQPPGLPTAVNDAGVVIGHTVDPTDQSLEQPIRWDQQGHGSQLSGLGYPTRANAINRAGVIAGTSEAHSVHPGSWGYSRAARWDPAGNVTDLGDAVGTFNEANGINDKGSICGRSGELNGSIYAVVWRRWSHTSQPLRHAR
jgi:probable HAF family extracellular repeat protein